MRKEGKPRGRRPLRKNIIRPRPSLSLLITLRISNPIKSLQEPNN